MRKSFQEREFSSNAFQAQPEMVFSLLKNPLKVQKNFRSFKDYIPSAHLKLQYHGFLNSKPLFTSYSNRM